jgi:hypothetical protein
MTFTFTPQQAQVILNALAARPYAEVSGLVESFINQAREQEELAANNQIITDVKEI